MSIHQSITTNGPNSPTNIPPNLKSDCLSIPVLKAIAFGGVETGSNNAHEAESPIINGNVIVLDTSMLMMRDMAIGMKIVAVAVLLMIFENTTVNNPNAM